MGFWRTIPGAKNLFPVSIGALRLACIVAAFFMAVGASYASSHDHADHDMDVDGACVVCTVAAQTDVKISPESASVIFQPHSVLGCAIQVHGLIVGAVACGAHRVRGPPLSISSH